MIEHLYFRTLPNATKARYFAKQEKIESEAYPVASDKFAEDALEYYFKTLVMYQRSELADFLIRSRTLAEACAEQILVSRDIALPTRDGKNDTSLFSLIAKIKGLVEKKLLNSFDNIEKFRKFRNDATHQIAPVTEEMLNKKGLFSKTLLTEVRFILKSVCPSVNEKHLNLLEEITDMAIASLD